MSAAARGKRSGWRRRMYATELCGTMNHIQWVHTSARSCARQTGPLGPTLKSARCRRTLGKLAESEHAVGDDRVRDAHALRLRCLVAPATCRRRKRTPI